MSFCPKKNMNLSDNKCDKKIINKSNKLLSAQGIQKSNNNTICLKSGEKIEDKKLNIVAR